MAVSFWRIKRFFLKHIMLSRFIDFFYVLYVLFLFTLVTFPRVSQRFSPELPREGLSLHLWAEQNIIIVQFFKKSVSILQNNTTKHYHRSSNGNGFWIRLEWIGFWYCTDTDIVFVNSTKISMNIVTTMQLNIEKPF